MKKIFLFAVCVCFLICPVYSESFQEYQKRQEEELRIFKEGQERDFDKFVEEQNQKLKEFIKNRELGYQKYWGVVNEESFSDAEKRSDDEEPLPFRVKFSVCFNCGDNGADLQVANEDQSGTFAWEAAKNSCEKRGDGWYLPTKDELRKIYGLKKEMGGFSDTEYWSISQEWKSSDRSSALSRAINFKDGKSGSYNPTETKRVRCVRRMPDSQGAKKVVVEYEKTLKDESRKEEVQQPKPVPQAEDKTPKDEGSKEEVKQPKPAPQAEDKTPKNVGKSKNESLKSSSKPNVFTPGKFIWPVQNYCHRVITSKFGLRQAIIKGKQVEGKKDNHKGIDIACQGVKIKGKPVTAAAAGKVVYAGFDKGRNKSYGNYIRIEHPDGSRTIYGHLDAITVNQGDNVMQGQEIGKAGNTGFVTGPHLHFEVRNNKNEPLDPLKFLPEMDPKK